MHLSKSALISLLSLSAVAPAFPCDLCGCYTPTLEVVHEKPYSLYGGVAEQFTHFGTDRVDGRRVANPTGEYLDSSITQLIVGGSFLDNRVGLQLTVPLIYRSFKRPAGFAIDRGRESGLGDLSLLANVVVFHKEALYQEIPGGFSKDGKTVLPPGRGEPDFSATLNLVAGIKFPTGDSSRLKENFNDTAVEGAPESGIHGHDLTLGSGSYDGIFGTQLFLRYKAIFFQADAQFTWRGYGSYQYRFANDFAWSGGPGVYLIRRAGGSLGLQCVLSGETKGYDRFQGIPDMDTGVTTLNVGPRITASFWRVTGDIGVDLPVVTNNTSFQSTADYRIRVGFTIRF